MNLTLQLISELVRAANEADKLTPFESKRLLNRAIATLRGFRDEVGVRGSNRAKDVLDLEVAAARVDGLPTTEMRYALLDAADLIRTLKIVLDGND